MYGLKTVYQWLTFRNAWNVATFTDVELSRTM